jgi:transcriptional regulator GlxA family with amidase domain
MTGVAGNPSLFTVYEGRIYTFGTPDCLAAFRADPKAALARARAAPARKNVAILVFEGVQIIDYTGPYEVFGQGGCNVFTVAEKADTITTAMGMMVLPRYTLSDCPAPDIVVLPGGDVDGHLDNPKIQEWIKSSAARARFVLSVCNGAFFLARTGLLDGLSATTFHGLIDELRREAPKTRVVSGQRYVDNGKIITGAGLSAGLDAALHVLEKMNGLAAAKAVAFNLEYHWQRTPDSNPTGGP